MLRHLSYPHYESLQSILSNLNHGSIVPSLRFAVRCMICMFPLIVLQHGITVSVTALFTRGSTRARKAFQAGITKAFDATPGDEIGVSTIVRNEHCTLRDDGADGRVIYL